MPQHHLPDDLLLAYAAGSLSESESLLVACHITLCPQCRHRVDNAEAIGGVLLGHTNVPQADIAAVADSPAATTTSQHNTGDDALLAKLLSQLDAPTPSGTAASGTAVADTIDDPKIDPKGIVPAPLFGLIGDLDSAPWKRKIPGMDMLQVPPQEDGKLVLVVRLAPGSKVPRHAHPGSESALVLSGGFTDDEGHFERGDVSVRDDSKLHEQRIDPGEPCVWLLVADGRFIPRSIIGWIGRILFDL